MAKKVKLPLDMGNDVKVRTIEELKEHYNSEKIIENYLNGQLIQWLNDRGYDHESGLVEDINGDDKAHLAAELAKVFEITLKDEVDVEAIEERKERMNKLREYTSDDDILENVDIVAFSQEDMADIVNDSDIIYLCGKEFTVSYKREGKKYIGVNDPTVIIKSNDIIDLESKNITVEGCTFSESTLANMKKTKPSSEHNSGSLALSKKFTGLESEIISSDITVECGETLRFENKEIHIRANIECCGTIEFENCIVHYNEISDTGIKMPNASKTNIEISNCQIIGHGYESTFVSVNDPNRCSINALDTDFIDCSNLINGGNKDTCEYGKISFEKCKFWNCLSVVCFFPGGTFNFMINDCIIILDDAPDYYKKVPDSMFFIILESEGKRSIKNTMVKATENFKLNSEKLIFDDEGLNITIFNICSAEISHCTFCGVSSCCEYASIISSSIFTECSEVYLGDNLESVNDCIFDQCSDIMSLCGADGTNIRNCQFNNCTGFIVWGSPENVIIENCNFINIILEDDDCLSLDKYSEINNCTFNGIRCSDDSTLLNYPVPDSAATVVTINDCKFRNCTTENGDGNINNFIRTEA